MRKCGKRLSLIFSVFFLASLSLWAFPGRGVKEEVPVMPMGATEAQASVIQEEPIQAAELPKMPSGTESSTTSEEPKSSSIEKAQIIADKGGLILGERQDELKLILSDLADDIATAQMASEAKDSEIEALRADLAEAEESTGSKAYIMLDGIMGFEQGIPQFGAGMTAGMRIGNHIMLEAGADYMVGGLDGYNQFSLDNFQFRFGAGWMI